MSKPSRGTMFGKFLRTVRWFKCRNCERTTYANRFPGGLCQSCSSKVQRKD